MAEPTGGLGPRLESPGSAYERPAPTGWSLPDRLTLLRLGALPFLWVLALFRNGVWLGVGLGLAALTDVLDGIIARRDRRVTAWGSRLDSIADHLLTASTVIWLVWLRPGFVAAELPLLATWLALAAIAFLAAWMKFPRVVDLHLYSAKVAGTLGYLFAIWLLLFGTYSALVFHLVVGAGLFAAAESLLVVLTRDAVDEHIGSVLRRT